MKLDEALAQLYDLKRDKVGTHERPHKPVLLLSILDLVEAGQVTNNQIELSDFLILAFTEYFSVVAQKNDSLNILLPFIHLQGEGFWDLTPKKGKSKEFKPSLKRIRENIEFGTFGAGLWKLINNGDSRSHIRQSIIARYFPGRSKELLALSNKLVIKFGGIPQEESPSLLQETEAKQYRDNAFRKVVTRLYDYRCSACGIRVILEKVLLVDAAHLIPFSVSQNDHPSNGLCLCKNHHWAMDRHLITPTQNFTWKVSSKMLDERIQDNNYLYQLDGKSILLPEDKRFQPDVDCIAWREERLIS